LNFLSFARSLIMFVRKHHMHGKNKRHRIQVPFLLVTVGLLILL
jgi:hypothetical protein